MTDAPGEITYAPGDLLLNDGREPVHVEVANTGDRAIQVGSHFHFFEVNRALRFDRMTAFGRRLDIPSGTSVRFEAGQRYRVALVPFGGWRKVRGFNGLTDGGEVAVAVRRAADAGFMSPAGVPK
jgi:urease beta subunit